MINRQLLEATLSQLKNKQRSITRRFPDFYSNPIKVKGIIAHGGVRLAGMEKDIWRFDVASGEEAGKSYEITMRWKNVVPELQRAIQDRRNWNKQKTKVNLSKVANYLFKKLDVEIKCSCPADLYYGGQYIRSKDKYKANYGDKEDRPPVQRNPKEYGSYCKHLTVFMKVMPFYKSDIAKWLKDNYSEVITKEEKNTSAKYQSYKKVSKKLGKRKPGK